MVKPTSYSSSTLPFELLHLIFFHLSPHDYDSARLVNKHWFSASLVESLLLQNTKNLSPSTSSFAPHHDNLSELVDTFSAQLSRCPASHHRIITARRRLDTTFLPAVEAMAFSEPAGNFVATVTGQGGGGKRTIWVHRLATGGFCERHVHAPVSGQGKLYLQLELEGKVLEVKLWEHSAFWALREIAVWYEGGKREMFKLREFRPLRVCGAQFGSGDGGAYVSRGGFRRNGRWWGVPRDGVMGRSADCACGGTWGCAKFYGPRKWPLVQDARYGFMVPKREEVKPYRETVKTGWVPMEIDGVEKACFAAEVPLAKGVSWRIMITQDQDVIITAPEPHTGTILREVYRFTAPQRKNVTTPEARHVSLARRQRFGGGKAWWALLAVAFANGEVWVWDFNIGELASWSDIGAPDCISLSPVKKAVSFMDGKGPKSIEVVKGADWEAVRPPKSLGWMGHVFGCRFAGRGDKLLVGTGEAVQIIEFGKPHQRGRDALRSYA